MEETNVTMTAEEMQGEPAAKENETKAEKFSKRQIKQCIEK